MHISMDKGCKISSGPLIGVCLLGDGFTGLCDSHTSSTSSSESDHNGTMIGVIKCDDLSQSVNNFRLHLQTQLPLVPPKFKFLCKNGWPVEKNQEPGLTIQTLINSNIVKIKRNFDIPRFGVRWYEGDFLGFIFVDFNCNLSEVRDAIGNQLVGKISSECSFEFRDKNGWPVVKNQEKELIIWDVCHHNYFNICKSESKLKDSMKDTSGTTKRPSKKCKLSKESRETDVLSSTENKKLEESASILISYVHGEASKHARDLKSELVNLGCKVFLDTDDIPSGCDWQDVINREVSNCVAFVALVTPSYGETRWTNREAKFADDKEKHIIPISFLDKWPPDQLAIQFLSLQYIQWKTREEIKLAEDLGEGYRARDIRYWDKGCVHRVAKEILKWLPQSGVSTPDGPSSSSHTGYRGFGAPDSMSLDLLTPSQTDVFLGLHNYSADEADIVISAHPKQRDFVENIKKILEEADFKVWSSLDMIDSSPSSQEDALYSSDSQQSFVSPGHVSNSPAVTPNHNSELSQDSAHTVKRPKFLFSYSAENGVHCSSSPFSRQEVCTPETPTTLAKLKQFKCKTEKAKLVILVVSEDYCASCTCKKQAFYCEHRKKVIAIKFGDFDLRCPLFSLYQEHDMLQGTNDEPFLMKLRDQVKEEVCRTFARRRKYEERIQKLVLDVKKRITCENSIYIIGGTRFISGRNEEICISLGTELAKLKWLSLATEGFFGIGEVLGRNFCEERVITNKGKPTLRNKEKHSSVFHIIPHRDEKDFSKKARQEEDGAFEKIPFGETIYCGNNVSERDAVVSSMFKICILIEGGYRTARLAEKFMWNDCIIIPIKSTGGAAAGKYSLPPRMLQVPCGVSESDWYKLENPRETAEEISYAVKKIIKTLFKIRDVKL